MSKILVNGKQQEIETGLTIAELIKLNDVQQPTMVSIQLNKKFVNRDVYDTTVVNDGDEVDFLYFMGGGQNPKPLKGL